MQINPHNFIHLQFKAGPPGTVKIRIVNARAPAGLIVPGKTVRGYKLGQEIENRCRIKYIYGIISRSVKNLYTKAKQNCRIKPRSGSKTGVMHNEARRLINQI